MLKSIVKGIAAGIAFVVLLPVLVLYTVRIVAFSTVSEFRSLVPGFGGIVLRRVWYKCTLASCGWDLVVDFLGKMNTPKTKVGDHVYIGLQSVVGWAEIGDDVMISGQVVVLSGKNQHGYSRIDVPMRLQEGKPQQVTIGKDVWIGVGAIVAADVAPHSVVAAGSVVTKTFDEYKILAGVPAQVIKGRQE